jgi:hypothetical protein
MHIPRCVNTNIDTNADGGTYAYTYTATDRRSDATNDAAISYSAVLLPIPVPYGFNNKWLSDGSSGTWRAWLAIIIKLTHIKIL